MGEQIIGLTIKESEIFSLHMGRCLIGSSFFYLESEGRGAPAGAKEKKRAAGK